MEHKAWQSFQSLELATYKSETNTHTDPSTELDLQYLFLRQRIMISGYYSRISKHVRIRLNGWVQKLDQIIANAIWKRNRNNYAKLMNLMCDCEVVVEPFHSLPPQGDVPKLGRHEINKIIDTVERQVKQEKPDSKVPIRGRLERPNAIKPQEYWSLIRRANNTRQQHDEEESIFIGKFTSVDEKFKDPFNFSKIQAGFHSISDENPSLKVSEQKKTYSSDLKNKDSNKKMESFNQKQNLSLTKAFGKPPRHIVVSINPKHRAILSQKWRQEGSSGEFKQITIEEEHSRLEAFRDDHNSTEFQNQTLKTEMFDPDLSIHPQMMPDFADISVDCDYTDELSERVRVPEDEGQSYFAYRMKERSWKCLPLLPN